MNQNSLLLFAIVFGVISCGTNELKQTSDQEHKSDDYFAKTHQTRCEANSKIVNYKIGDLVCTKSEIEINSSEKLDIQFITINKKSEDPYEYGYQELHRYKDGAIVEKMKLRRDDDAYWSQVPFVRIRKQKYLADLDGDGFLEFAVLPFHPGSAIWMNARIFSLKEKIEYWGKGDINMKGTHLCS